MPIAHAAAYHARAGSAASASAHSAPTRRAWLRAGGVVSGSSETDGGFHRWSAEASRCASSTVTSCSRT